jgi:glutamyl-tRNA reductase
MPMQVLITNRSREKAEDLAKALGNGSAVVDLEDVNRGVYLRHF